ncbi:MAG: beta-ketoacyl-[acyl-carrier-protein] synthase family protein [Geobacteraceae bacterium]|nr:beta-ketoacyl-[acyl-carrier-protein] synthase family protein [Geobacteraceae bacterium]
MKGEYPITGLGVVSAAGADLASSLKSMSAGERNHSSLTLFSSTLSYPVFECRSELSRESRTVALLLSAVHQAMNDAALSSFDGLRVGVCIGTTVACQLNDLDFYRSYRETGAPPLEPVDSFLAGNPAEYLSRKYNLKGPVLSVVNACSSGTDAIGIALSWLKADLCDLVIAGGADELSLIPYSGFSSLGILNPDLCSPFDRDRKGLNLGEGAGVMIVEKRQSALQRSLTPSLFLAGYGLFADAYHLTAPDPDGASLEKAVRVALQEGGVGPEDIAFVNAHGTGTHDNDLVEGNTLARIFGADLKVLSTKGYTGHTLGAAGGLEAVFAAAALKEGWLPASAGFSIQDEAIAVTPLMERTSITGTYALSTSLAFGGNNAAVLIGVEGR